MFSKQRHLRHDLGLGDSGRIRPDPAENQGLGSAEGVQARVLIFGNYNTCIKSV
jgi:hypothetical protein